MMNIRYLLLLITFHLCEGKVSALLTGEATATGAGVRGRLSQKGVNYLANVLTNTLMPEVASVDGNFKPSFVHLPAEKISITSMRLIFRSPPKSVISSTLAPNNVHIRIPKIDIIGKSELSIPGVPTTVIAEVYAATFNISLNVSVLRSKIGAPKLGLNNCNVVNMSAIEANLDGGSPAFKDAVLKQQLKDSLVAQGSELIDKLVCDRIKFVLEDRINKRFDILPLKLTLAKTNNSLVLDELTKKLRQSSRGRRDAAFDLTRQRRAALISSFNVSCAEKLYLDYTLVSDPWVSPLGLELESSGEVSIKGQGGTPFGPAKIPFPNTVNEDYMLQMAVSDYMSNSLLYHGHKIGLFNTRVDPKTPHFGPIMRTSCSMTTGLMFCLGDLFPTLRKLHPDHRLALFFDTVEAPAIQFRPPSTGGITFSLIGKIVFLLINQKDVNVESKVAEMEIDVKAHMKLRLSNTDVKPKISLDTIKLTTLSPEILLQEELDQAVMLAREVLQRMVNDILSDGIPIPLHPLFILNKPKIKILERALLLQTNFDINEILLQKLVTNDILNHHETKNMVRRAVTSNINASVKDTRAVASKALPNPLNWDSAVAPAA